MVWVLALVAALAGGLFARKRGGRGVDVAQYAAVWGIIGLLLGTVLVIAGERVLL
jgi:hypothetical protein